MKKTIIAATALLVGGSTTAQTQDRLDSTIDEAAGRVLARKIGDLRPGFDIGDVPALVRAMAPADIRAARKLSRF